MIWLYNSVICTIIVLMGSLHTSLANTGCANSCSGHGYCENVHGGRTCLCFPGFHGADCSVRVCPSGRAWVDYPSADDVAHADFVECSNMGHCNRETGKCSCREGFTGPSCDQLACPTAVGVSGLDQSCAGHGRCMTLANINAHPDYLSYYTAPLYDTDWDADMIAGCVCDYGYTGIDCSLKSCMKGDDPLTAGVDEVQLLDCTVTTSSDGLQLIFRGRKTRVIPYDATETLIEAYLEELGEPYLEDVTVAFISGTEMCSVGGSTTSITIHVPQGPMTDTPLSYITVGSFTGTVQIFSGGDASVLNPGSTSVVGTKEYVTCSNHGLCDTDMIYNPTGYTAGLGICMCYEGWRSSDGLGGAGDRNDCGYNWAGGAVTFNSTLDTICPYTGDHKLCGDHGSCSDHTSGNCICDDGYSGPACDHVTCNSSNAWFGNVGADHSSMSECGNMGTCDYTTGLCMNCGGNWGTFTGYDCESMSCYSDPDTGNSCSDNGQCLSMSELAEVAWTPEKTLSGYSYTTPWDANMIRGCNCERAQAYDNIYYKDYDYLKTSENPDTSKIYWNVLTGDADGTSESSRFKFFRGPNGWATTDFMGYDCLKKRCPTGDNPRTRGVNEIQRITCTATSGNFTVLFRENSTMTMDYDVSATGLAHRLRQIYTIRDVAVTYSSGDALCTSDGSNYADIEFLSEYGDLPMIELGVSFLSDSYTFKINQVIRGTKEDLECSQQGICNEDTGQCFCMPGFTSSADSVSGGKISTSAGDRGDCGYETKFGLKNIDYTGM